MKSALAGRRQILKEQACSFKGHQPGEAVVSVAYHYQAVYVKFIGTHDEYDDIDAETVEMED